MKNYTVTTTSSLRNLCIKNNWFTEGSNKQYEKLFYANEHRCPIEEIATIIWLCSDNEWSRRDILFELKDTRIDFWKHVFGIENESAIYKFYSIYDTIFEATFKQFVEDALCSGESEFNYDTVTAIVDCNGYTIWEQE